MGELTDEDRLGTHSYMLFHQRPLALLQMLFAN